MATALCPDCGQKIIIGPKPRRGQRVSCQHCDVDLEIVSTSPLELDWPEFDADDDFEVDDWDDDEFDDDDFEEWDDDDDVPEQDDDDY
jgi:lysine biosynthesis protein LysW